MAREPDLFDLGLLPYACVRCGKDFWASNREMSSLPNLLCVGCFTELTLFDDPNSSRLDRRLAYRLKELDSRDQAKQNGSYDNKPPEDWS